MKISTDVVVPSLINHGFRFSLRTLLIAVAILAVLLGYVGWQAKIVRDRKAFIQQNPEAFRLESWESPQWFGEAEIPWIRSVLGDEGRGWVRMSEASTDEEMASVNALFPEARLYRKGDPDLWKKK